MRFFVILLVSLAGCAEHAAPRTSPGSRAGAVSEAAVRAHLEFLASDALNGRGSGTRDEQIAAEYVGAHFRRLGLKPGRAGGSYVQTVEIVRTAAAGKPSIAIGDAVKWTFGKEFVATAVSGPTVTGALQRIGGSAAAVKRGAVVFLPEENMDLAAQVVLAGAAAVFMKRTLTPAQWETQSNRTPTLGIRLTGVPPEALIRPTVVSLNADAAASLASVPDGAQVRIDTPAGEPTKSHTYNAVAILAGKHPAGEAILISAHRGDRFDDRSAQLVGEHEVQAELETRYEALIFRLKAEATGSRSFRL